MQPASSSMKAIAPMLCKLIPRLGSDHPGEVVATAAAIDRVLRAAGQDWHTLANALAVTFDPEPDEADWRAIVASCAVHPTRLTKREWDFLRSLKDWRGDLTDRQKFWLNRIAARARRYK
jgi:hypothetical protein